MSKYQKLLKKVLSTKCDTSITFNDLCYLLDRFGFEKRIKGDHHIYYKNNILEIINLQPLGKLSKAYQVKQVRNIILKYKLGNDNE